MPDIVRILQFLIDLVLWIPRKIYELAMDALATVLNATIEACTVCTNVITEIPNAYNAMSSIHGLMWILGWFNIGTGITLCAGALFIRFIIRRLPIIG